MDFFRTNDCLKFTVSQCPFKKDTFKARQGSANSCAYVKIVAAVTFGLLTIVKTGITMVSYFGNVTASLFALTIIRKFTPT